MIGAQTSTETIRPHQDLAKLTKSGWRSLEFLCTHEDNEVQHKADQISLAWFRLKTELKSRCIFFFDRTLNDENITMVGMERITERDKQYANDNKYSIRLVAFATLRAEVVYGMVTPRFLSADHMLLSNSLQSGSTLIQVEENQWQVFQMSLKQKPLTSTFLHPSMNYAVEPSVGLSAPQPCIEVFVSLKTLEGFSFEEMDEINSGFSSSSYHFVIAKIRLNKFRDFSAKCDRSIIRISSIIQSPRELKSSKGTD